jgi:ribosomal protein S18 acetylase RimI-like enzyme
VRGPLRWPRPRPLAKLFARHRSPREEGPIDTPAVTIRAATRADLPSIGRLAALLVGAHHDLDPARFIAATPRTAEGYASFLGTQLDAAGMLVLVAEREGRLIGYTFAGVEGHDWMSLRGPAGVLHDIVVDPDARRLGVARRLLDATLDALAARGAPRVVLWTAERNDAAQRLFAGVGFRRTMLEMTRELGEDDRAGARA